MASKKTTKSDEKLFNELSTSVELSQLYTPANPEAKIIGGYSDARLKKHIYILDNGSKILVDPKSDPIQDIYVKSKSIKVIQNSDTLTIVPEDDKSSSKKKSNKEGNNNDNSSGNNKIIIPYKPADYTPLLRALGENQQKLYGLTASGFEATLLGLSKLSKNQEELAKGQRALFQKQQELDKKILAVASGVSGLSIAVSNLYMKLNILFALMLGLIVFVVIMFGLQYYLYKQQERRFELLLLLTLMNNKRYKSQKTNK